MQNANKPWIAHTGYEIGPVTITWEKQTIEACPECGGAIVLVFARDKQGGTWLRPECLSCAFVGKACPPVE